MSDIFKSLNDTQEAGTIQKDELAALKERADLMGISYPANITLAALKKKVNDRIEEKDAEDEAEAGNPEDDFELGADGTVKQVGAAEKVFPSLGSDETQEKPEVVEKPEPAVSKPIPEVKTTRKLTFREQLYRDNMKLIRVRIHQLDPKKKDLLGEVFTVSNKYLGNLSKFVPYGEQQGENGYMMEYWLYTMLKERKFSSIRTVKRNGREFNEARDVPEFHLEVLPDPTPEELAQLRANQHGMGSLEGN